MNLLETTPAVAGLKLTASMVTAPDSPLSVRTRYLLRKLELKAAAVYSREEIVTALESAGFSGSDRLAILMELDQTHRRGALRIEDWPAQPGVPNGLPFGPAVKRVGVFYRAAASEEEAFRQLPRQVKLVLERAGVEQLPIASGALKEKLAAAGVDATTRLAIAIDLNRAGFLAA